MQGSWSKINNGVQVQLEYQEINETCYFDVANLSSYDLILGTPFLFQHSALVGLNEARVIVGSDNSLSIDGEHTGRLSAWSIEMVDEELSKVQDVLMDYADALGLLKDPSTKPLPPFRAINHKTPLIDEDKIYPWRPARCPEKFRAQWIEKKNNYITTGWWHVTASHNTVPLMCIPKPNKPIDKPEMGVLIDL